MAKEGIPKEIIEELHIDKVEEMQKDFEVLARVEPHQIKLPIPSSLIKDLELDTKLKGKKIKLYYDEDKKELRYKI